MCCAVFAKDSLEEKVIRFPTSVSQRDIHQFRVKLVLHSAPPVDAGLGVKVGWLTLSSNVKRMFQGKTNNSTGSDLCCISERL